MHGGEKEIISPLKPIVRIATEEETKSPNYPLLKENEKILQNAHLENKEKLNIIKLPMPKQIVYEGIPLPASYANFLILNNLVLVPTFNDEKDPFVLNLFKNLFPGRIILGIHAVDLVWGLGTIHCSSHEVPLNNKI